MTTAATFGAVEARARLHVLGPITVCRDPRRRVREGRHRLAAGGAVIGLMNIGTSTRAPVVIDFGSFLLACLFLPGVSVTALLSWPAEAATRPAAAVTQP